MYVKKGREEIPFDYKMCFPIRSYKASSYMMQWMVPYGTGWGFGSPGGGTACSPTCSPPIVITNTIWSEKRSMSGFCLSPEPSSAWPFVMIEVIEMMSSHHHNYLEGGRLTGATRDSMPLGYATDTMLFSTAWGHARSQTDFCLANRGSVSVNCSLNISGS